MIGTQSTIKSGIYESYLHKINPELTVVSKACPLFVPLVEEGLFEDRITEDVVSRYLHDMKEYEIDALVLGCTHYPFVKDAIAEVMGNTVEFFDGGAGVARETRRRLMEKELLYTGDRKGRVIFENSAATLEKLRLCEILLNSK